ncbi:hypothetical protein CXG81DRAFT_19610 [Caulochytrium protostelioides]|uniref:Uncharacterized protein n=1 Tax=Caulochytrium protostelioides TaxID=1555241 RepID=A0A4P9X5L2_9FUNG|nr:hypothetical protein CXG81DRAFT_19610 [Caulochytrium protostelioides]|eukprot:RKP00425.1 hypothetical protein CXG81DRAFT_19610 [Caulochytrium protostelioides]
MDHEPQVLANSLAKRPAHATAMLDDPFADLELLSDIPSDMMMASQAPDVNADASKALDQPLTAIKTSRTIEHRRPAVDTVVTRHSNADSAPSATSPKPQEVDTREPSLEDIPASVRQLEMDVASLYDSGHPGPVPASVAEEPRDVPQTLASVHPPYPTSPRAPSHTQTSEHSSANQDPEHGAKNHETYGGSDALHPDSRPEQHSGFESDFMSLSELPDEILEINLQEPFQYTKGDAIELEISKLHETLEQQCTERFIQVQEILQEIVGTIYDDLACDAA